MKCNKGRFEPVDYHCSSHPLSLCVIVKNVTKGATERTDIVQQQEDNTHINVQMQYNGKNIIIIYVNT